MLKRIGVIGCAGIPANYGGFETLVDNLVRELQDDYKFLVYCSSFSYKVKINEYHKARLIYIPLKANGRSSILYDMFSILNSINKVDVLLVLGVGGAFLFPIIRLFTNKKIVVHIDGLEWTREKWGSFAKAYLRFQERLSVKFAHKVIADNEAIQSYILTQYKSDSRYAPYGGDHTRSIQLKEETKAKLGIQGSDYFFSVCRIEPENNIHIILEAFQSFPDSKLIFIGNWMASAYGESLRDSYKNSANIILLDPIYNQNDLDELRSNCWGYVHGHSAGGTNPSLVEAMNLGLAVIAWDVDYNRFTTENTALYFKSTNDLKDVLRKVKNNLVDLGVISNKLKSVAQSKYTWSIVARQYYNILHD